MVHRSFNGNTEQAHNAAPVPDLAPLVKSARWRYDLAKRIKQYVRDDGFVLATETLSQDEITRLGGATPKARQNAETQNGGTNMQESTHQDKTPDSVEKMKLSGQTFNGIEIVGLTGNKDRVGNRLVEAICHCGNRFEGIAGNIKSGRIKSCGCVRGRKPVTAKKGRKQPITRSARKSSPPPQLQTRQPDLPARDVYLTITNRHHDLKGVASVIEGIVSISAQVSPAALEAMLAELDRMEAHAPLIPLRGFEDARRVIPQYREMVKSFLSFRRSLDSVEGTV